MAGTNGGPPLRPRHRRGGGSGFFWFLTGGLLGALGVAVAWMMDERAGPPGGAADHPRTAHAQSQPPPQTPPKLRYDYPTILPDLEVVVPEEDMSDRPPALPPPPEPDPPPAKELPKTAVKAPAKEPGKEGAKEAAKTPSKEATKTPAKEPAKPIAKEPAKEPTKPATKETAKEPTKPVAKDTPKDPAKTAQPEKPAETAPKGGDSETYILQVASLGTPAEAEQFKAKLAAQGIAASIQQASVDGKTRYRIRTGPFKGKEAANKARAQLASRGHQAITIKLK